MSDKNVIRTDKYDIQLIHEANEFIIFKKYNKAPESITPSLIYEVVYNMFFKIKQSENKIKKKDKQINELKYEINHLKFFG